MPERKVVLIACGKTKYHAPTTAADLYRGALFKKSLAYAKALEPNEIWILSAKYGLLALSDRVEPYEMTLSKMTIKSRRDWAERVLYSLRQRADLASDIFVFLAGLHYRRYLTPCIANSIAPLEGLGFGRQLSWLSHQATKELNR